MWSLEGYPGENPQYFVLSHIPARGDERMYYLVHTRNYTSEKKEKGQHPDRARWQLFALFGRGSDPSSASIMQVVSIGHTALVEALEAHVTSLGNFPSQFERLYDAQDVCKHLCRAGMGIGLWATPTTEHLVNGLAWSPARFCWVLADAIRQRAKYQCYREEFKGQFGPLASRTSLLPEVGPFLDQTGVALCLEDAVAYTLTDDFDGLKDYESVRFRMMFNKFGAEHRPAPEKISSEAHTSPPSEVAATPPQQDRSEEMAQNPSLKTELKDIHSEAFRRAAVNKGRRSVMRLIKAKLRDAGVTDAVLESPFFEPAVAVFVPFALLAATDSLAGPLAGKIDVTRLRETSKLMLESGITHSYEELLPEIDDLIGVIVQVGQMMLMSAPAAPEIAEDENKPAALPSPANEISSAKSADLDAVEEW